MNFETSTPVGLANHSLQMQRTNRLLVRAVLFSSLVLALQVMSACTVTREYAGDKKRQQQEMAKSKATSEERMREMHAQMEQERARLQSMEWKQRLQTATVQMQDKLRFRTGSADLNDEAREELRKLASLLIEKPGEKLRLKGYTDSRGAPTINQALARSRVEAVRSELIAQGVQADQIDVVVEGESRPIATNTTAAGRAKNRRVEVEVLGPPAG